MKINTVLFDMGGTLENISYDDEIRLKACQEMLGFLKDRSIKLEVSDEVFWKVLRKRNEEYVKWTERTMREAQPFEIWSKWNLKDYNIADNRLKEISEALAAMWEIKFYKRECKKEAPAVLKNLKNRGYQLGIVSNTTSRTQVFNLLKAYGINQYFACISLSSIHGYRKPKASIFLEALDAIGSVPERSAYIGDTVSRDIAGSKAAGFALAIQIKSSLTGLKDVNAGGISPDYIIENLNELLDILP
jgi:putative hydrolase of the HAD superfamily